MTGVAVYELPPGENAFPYHFDLGDEEWLFVVDGALRADPYGQLDARAGDIVCFPPGPTAHIAVERLGRRGGLRSCRPAPTAVVVAVRPDSDPVDIEAPGFFQIVPLDVSMDLGARAVNLFDLELTLDEDDPTGITRYRRLAPELGGERLAFNVSSAPGGACARTTRDRRRGWMVVLRPADRAHARGERELARGQRVLSDGGPARTR